MIIKEYNSDNYEFGGYEFDPYSNWTDVWESVIEPIIETHIINYTEEEMDDVDTLINIFMEEYGCFDSVREACERFFDANKI